MDKVILSGESSCSDSEIDDTNDNKPIEESTCAWPNQEHLDTDGGNAKR